jgi:hypothetical protein
VPTLTAQENVEAALVPLHVSAAARRQRASAGFQPPDLTADRLRPPDLGFRSVGA